MDSFEDTRLKDLVILPVFPSPTSAARTHKLCVIAAFSSVPGVIDCTHKTIHVPLHNEVSFINLHLICRWCLLPGLGKLMQLPSS